MRTIIRWVLALGVVASVLFLAALAVGRSDQSHQRAFQFTYTARITELPPDGRVVRIWIPLAKSIRNQTVLSRQIRSAHPYQISQEPVYDNDILYLRVTAPFPQPIEVAVDYQVVVQSSPWPARHAGSDPVLTPEERALYLRDEPFMVVNETIARVAQDAIKDRDGVRKQAQGIYEYVIQHMRYEKTTPGWGQGDTLRACRLGVGNCTDFHSLFISLARSVEIPARFVIGAPVPDASEGEVPGYHCWAEFYNPEEGWVPVDASEAWKHPNLREYYFGTPDPNKFLINVGRNLQLVPAQAGSPVNIFVHPYVEVDDHVVRAGHAQFHFKTLERKEEQT